MLKKIREYFSPLSSFDRLAATTLSVTCFVLPIFFWPSPGMPIDAYKKVLLFLGTMLALIFWLAARLQTGQFSLPKNPPLFILGGLVVSTLVSSVFSFNPRLSLSGFGLEQDTLMSLAIAVALIFLVSIYFRSKRQIFKSFLAIISSALVVISAQVLILFSVFFPSYFTIGSSNLIGKWNSFGVFLGLVTLISLISLDLIVSPSRRILRFFLYFSLVSSLIGLVLVNLSIVWVLLSLIIALLLIYRFVGSQKEEGSHRLSKLSLAVLIISLIMSIVGRVGAPLGNSIANLNNRIGVSNLEVRPSWTGTWQIIRHALTEKVGKRPLFVSTLIGVGPNHFTYEWLQHKPSGVNETKFWNVDFNSGVGLIPSFIVGTGLLGMILWVVFLGSLIIYGFKSLRQVKEDRLGHALMILSWSSVIYLWAVLVVYVPDTLIFALAFIVTGFWLGLSTSFGVFSDWTRDIDRSGKKGVIYATVILAAILVAVIGLYLGLEKYWSTSLFRQGLYSLNVENKLDKSQDFVVRAIGHSEQDLYYRTMIDLSLAKMNQLLASQTTPKDRLLAAFSQTLSVATTSASRAIYLDPNNYLNYSYSGKLYESLMPLQIKGAYEWSLASYKEAARVNPSNPQIYVDLARLEVANKNYSGAESYAKKALALKSNFVAAYTLLAQLDVERGNVAAGIDLLERAAAADPQNSEILFQLGYLRFKNEGYSDAVQALEQAVAVAPNYSNAKYFLGLSYSKLGEVDKAIKQFQDIKALNPGNAEVEGILRNLEAGRAPLAAPARAKNSKTEKKK